MWRVLEGQAVEDATVRANERKRVEDADGSRMVVQQLPEVRLAQPPADVLAGMMQTTPGTTVERPSRRAR